MTSARRGMTMIEVVAATLTLALAAAMISGGVSFSASVAERNRQRLAAAEVAHRIIITHVRDPREMQGQPKRVFFDGRYYQFDLDEELVARDVAGEGPARRTQKKITDAGLEEKLNAQLFRITVRVRLDDDKSESPRPVLATMTRMFNPFMGDPDAMIFRLMNDPSISNQLDR